MRYDVETALAQVFANYLQSTVEPAKLKDCPIVTFFDPMSVDDANRIIVFCPHCQSDPTTVGNFDARLEIGVKSQWTQENIKNDFDAHFQRVNEVRDKIWPAGLMAALQDSAVAVEGLLIEYVQPRRDMTTSIKKEGWLYSETGFQVRCMATTAPIYN